MRNLLLEADSKIGTEKSGILGTYFLVQTDEKANYSVQLSFSKDARDIKRVMFVITNLRGVKLKDAPDQIKEKSGGIASANFYFDAEPDLATDYRLYVYDESDKENYRDSLLFSFGDGVKSVYRNETERAKPAVPDDGDDSSVDASPTDKVEPDIPGDEPVKKGGSKKKDPTPAKPGREGAGAKDAPSIPATDRMRGGQPHDGGTPEGWTKIITLDDPEGDRTGEKYGEPRYRPKNRGGLGIGDYVGPKFKYEAFIDPSAIKTQKDLVDSNKKSVYFRVSEDSFDQTVDQDPKSSKDFDFTGLEVWSDGTWSGTKPSGISNANLTNLRFTFEELWNALKDKAGETSLPPGGEPTAVPPGGTPSKDDKPGEGGAEGDAPGKAPEGDGTVSGGGIEATLGDKGCCHKPDKLFFECYSDDYLEQGFPNGLDSSDESGFYAPEKEYSGPVNRFRRGIEKEGSGWKHFIYTMRDKVEVYTEGNNLLDYSSPRTISKIRIRLNNGSYRDSASDANGIAVLLPILRRIILDVRIFLPQRDECGIPDDRIPAITNFTQWTSGGMQESYDLEIRKRVRQILRGS